MEIYREIEKNTVDGTLWPCGVAPSMALVKSAYFTYPVDGASPVFNAMNFDPGVYHIHTLAKYLQTPIEYQKRWTCF